MSGELLFKILVIAILLFILLSLSGGLFFLIKDKKKNSNRMVTSLSFRVGLSLILFFLLFYGFYSGLIHPHGM
ncbi:twin transmembrane helix small protein [Candidatus Methylopumilus planktonicus]|jgi:F0F1-type ATP synthase membrane subunit a|uniref:twin transmembrane helix small protein n=1 Tax=Candidatus Methylopumilus planktonicus TaxID=1581557 RepID=UPI001EC93C9D|nr:twin transmembrane helix small protein [Candidatus Methylopumilus sp.]